MTDHVKTYVASQQDATDEFFEHFGVPGMKWGQRKAGLAATNKALNKASKAKDAAERRSNIDAARQRINSGVHRQAYKDAKQQYKANKLAMGSREAKKILNGVKEKNLKDFETASQYRDGREKAKVILGAVAGVTLATAFSMAKYRI